MPCRSRRWSSVFAAAALAVAAGAQSGPAATPATPAAPRSPHGQLRNVGVLVFPGVELLDFAGPVEVFTEANDLDPAFRVFLVGAERGPLRTKNAATIVPDYTVGDCPRIDVLVIPGGETRTLSGDYPLARFLKARAPATEITYSVCNGVFALADADMLDGLELTTHWSSIQWLREAVPTAKVHADRRVVDNGHIVTAAGVSAGIDGALYLVDRLLGRRAAQRTARRMEYTWTPALAERTAADANEKARQAWYASDWKGAAAEYEPMIADRPDDTIARGRLGMCRALLRDYAAALPLLERAAREQPDASLWPYGLGIVHKSEGRHADAVAALQRAHELAPDSLGIQQFLGREQFAVGKWRECIDNLTAIRLRGAGDHRTLMQVALAKLALGDRDGALQCIEESAALREEELFESLADARFDPLRQEARFVRARAQAETRAGKK